ncbi:hypothetical protein ACFFJY_14380 [Fictibacillus aquaticus]|uniref:Uncharacterized protein n=1 Tax=Fictibacillus aquaticus TaxID=2021314 RepID=A0A235FEI4_9BACL|nr:hypothetical protein [Fictibacillus aquaticus]OYD59403.1 hypothetical protein CGZ90_05805 [Fictibacillus aquaticus]
MNLKKTMLVVSVGLNFVLGFIVYQAANKDGPVDVGLSFKEAVRVENYALAQTLVAEGRKKNVSKETLKEINEIMSAGTSYKTYQLLEFNNDEMVLLHLTPDKKYEIQDVVIVPEELKSLFK